MFEQSRRREVPDWVPDSWRDRVEPWFQRRWPAEVWKGVQGRQYHFVAWIWYALVIALVMTSPYWWRSRHATGQAHTKNPAV